MLDRRLHQAYKMAMQGPRLRLKDPAGYIARMKTVHATFEAGVFKPSTFVPLPEHCEVEFEPRVVNRRPASESTADIYTVLNERYRCGETDVAARHDEHQP